MDEYLLEPPAPLNVRFTIFGVYENVAEITEMVAEVMCATRLYSNLLISVVMTDARRL